MKQVPEIQWVKGKLSEPKGRPLAIVVSGEGEDKERSKRISNFVAKSLSLSAETARFVSEELSRRKFSGKDGQSALLTIFSGGNNSASHILVLGLSPGKNIFDRYQGLRRLGSTVAMRANDLGWSAVAVVAPGLDFNSEDATAAFIEGVNLSRYRFLNYKEKKAEEGQSLKSIFVYSPKILSPTRLKLATARGEALSSAIVRCRDLINTPAADCTPKDLVAECKALAKESRLGVKVWGKSELKRIGAQGLLTVAKGSDEEPFLVRLRYEPRGARGERIALVGKGVTFDSGGLSIKTGSGMETMKRDMSGAAAVISVMRVIAALKPKVKLDVYVALTENMINGQAMRPGDVIKSLSGKTIEVLNTDAEGRLILADALAFAEREGAGVIVDVATLTGACMVALGLEYAGLFSDDEKLVKALEVAAERSGERLWRMPLAPEYEDLIKSSVADIKNTGGSFGGAITAALFLKHFVKKARWAHLDIAGPSWSDKDKGYIKIGGVGFAVRTLVSFVVN